MDLSGSDAAPKSDVASGPSEARTSGGPASAASIAIPPPVDVQAAPAVMAAPAGGAAARAAWPSQLRRWLRRLALLIAALLAAVLALMLLLRFVDPPGTPIMAVTWLAGTPVVHTWVPLERISPHLVRAVIAAEDARFCLHYGIDFGELRAAIEDARRGNPRGASTITMQVTKNLLLWPGKSYVRKAIELPLALTLDALWPKRRILEVYLNVAEWGEGLYGAEAAARRYFDKPAARLVEYEAARLAVSLPNPAERDAGEPDDTVERLAERLMGRMRDRVPLGCIR
jgi:monofunctional biosynthetic peptidoglycan transglycosylase